MRIKPIFFSIIVLAAALSCSKENVSTPQTDSETSTAVPADARAGSIRVKLTSELTSLPEDGTMYIGGLGKCTVTPVIKPGGKFEQRHRKYGLHLWYSIRFDKNIPLTKASGELRDNLPGVDCIVYDTPIRRYTTTFNDPYLSYQWHYHNTGTNALHAVEGCDINLFDAWDISTGSPNVVVAIIDGGIDYDHDDIAQNMYINEAEKNGTKGVDDDGNGYVDDVYGYNFLANHEGPNIIAESHGTHVAGTVAAVNNNGIGVGGIAGGNGSSSTGVRLMSCQTNGDDDDEGAYIIAAIVYAADNGAVLANCSWGMAGEDESIKEAIQYFNEVAGTDGDGNQTGPMKGGLMIFAAGNDNTTTSFPAELDDVFAVAAVGPNYQKAYYSNYGSWVDITAPGGDAQLNALVRSTLPDNEYGTMQGTSMACPHVTGVAALVVSYFGGEGFTREKLINILKATANPVIYETSYNSSYLSGKLGAGLVDAYAALTATSSIPEPVENVEGSSKANIITLGWSLPSEGSLPDKVNIYHSTSSLSSLDVDNLPEGVAKTTVAVESKTAGAKMSCKLEGLEFNTDYYFRLEGESNLGITSVLSDEIKIATVGNTVPTIEAASETSISLKSHEKGTILFNVSDPDGQGLTCRLSEGLDGASVSLSGDVATVSINAAKAADGTTYNGTITVSDGYEEASANISYTVLSNNAPVVTNAMSNIVFSSKSESLTLNLSEYFTDPDGETPVYSASSDGNGLQATIATYALKLTSKAYGLYSVKVNATDNRSEVASQTFKVLVRDGSKPVDIYPNPVVDKLNIRAGEDNTAHITIYNKAGATVYDNSNASYGPFSPLSIDMTSLAGGVYYVKIDSGSTNETYSISKK